MKKLTAPKKPFAMDVQYADSPDAGAVTTLKTTFHKTESAALERLADLRRRAHVIQHQIYRRAEFS